VYAGKASDTEPSEAAKIAHVNDAEQQPLERELTLSTSR
jgi:hypothetical protein